MPYNEALADRVRTALSFLPGVDEVQKMGGLSFMLGGKVCVRVDGDELLCRIDPAAHNEALQRVGAREWIYKGKPMKGWVFVGEEGLNDLPAWASLAVAFNAKAKSSSRKKVA